MDKIKELVWGEGGVLQDSRGLETYGVGWRDLGVISSWRRKVRRKRVGQRESVRGGRGGEGSEERWLRLKIGVRREVPVRSLSRKNRVEQKLRLAFLGASVADGR